MRTRACSILRPRAGRGGSRRAGKEQELRWSLSRQARQTAPSPHTFALCWGCMMRAWSGRRWRDPDGTARVKQEINCTDAFLRGHGTYVVDGRLLASVRPASKPSSLSLSRSSLAHQFREPELFSAPELTDSLRKSRKSTEEKSINPIWAELGFPARDGGRLARRCGGS